ncbi:MAG: helix-turn-helix domain-containing protein [Myxococcota bacterium]
MERKRFEGAPCSIARSVDILGDWWAPLIIREALYGTRRFDAFQRWLGIGRNILTKRLSQLVEQGVLERVRYQEKPERFEYRLTEKGNDAAQVLIAMMPFGERWQFEPGHEPIRLFDRRTGDRVHPMLVDAETGEPIDVENLFPGPGPAFPADESIRRERFAEYYRRSVDEA